MFRLPACLLLVAGLALHPGRLARGEPPASEVGRQADARTARVDHLGDPLPDGAVARLGTSRLCYGDSWLAFSPDSRLLAVGNPFSSVRLCEVNTGKELWRVDTPNFLGHGFTYSWSILAFSPDGKVLAGGCSDNTVRLWDVPTGRELRRLPTGILPTVLAFDRGGRSLAVAGMGKGIEVWDAVQGKQQARLGDLSEFTRLAFAPDGKTITGLSPVPNTSDKEVIVSWDIVTGRERTRKPSESAYWCASALAADGSRVAALTADGKGIRLLDPATGKERCRIEAEAGASAGVAFADDGRLLVAGGTDGIVRWWETTGGKRLGQLRALSTGLECLAVSRDGKLVAVTGRADMRVHVWDLARGRELHTFPGHRHGPLAVSFLPDNRTVATVNRDHIQSGPIRQWASWSLRRWDATSGKELAVIQKDPGGEVRLMAFSPDGCLAVTVVHDGTLRLWDVAAGKELRHWRVPTGDQITKTPTQVIKTPYPLISEPTFSPDGKLLLAAHGATVSRWEVATGKELPALKVAGTAQFTRCFASPDGRTLLLTGLWSPPPAPAAAPSAGPRQREILLDATSGRVLRELVRRGGAPMPCCAFAPDGKTLALEEGSAVQLWEVASGQERGRLEAPGRFVSGLAFSPDSRTLVGTGDNPHWLQLWEPASGRVLGRMDQPPGRARDSCLAFSPDGTRLAVTGSATDALVYDTGALLGHPLPGGAKLSGEELEVLWADLTGADGARAYLAIERLAASPSESVPFLKRRYKHPPAVDERRLARLIADLDDDHFAVRDRATRELEAFGARAEPALQQALANQPSPEVRFQAERLLERLKSGKAAPSAELVCLRVLEALEHSASPSARQALTELAADEPASRLAQEAKAALERLARRGVVAR
jgi:WD40 repeat protein